MKVVTRRASVGAAIRHQLSPSQLRAALWAATRQGHPRHAKGQDPRWCPHHPGHGCQLRPCRACGRTS